MSGYMEALAPTVDNFHISVYFTAAVAAVGTIYSLVQFFGTFAKFLPLNEILRNGDNRPRKKKLKHATQTSVACENGA